MKNVVKRFKNHSLFVGVLFLALGMTSCNDDDDGDIIDPETESSLMASDQEIVDNSITVSSVDADDDAWLIVRRGTDTGELVAEPMYIPEGTDTDVNIPLNTDANIQDGETLVLVLHEDNDDEVWNEDDDFPFMDLNDQEVQVTITVSTDGDTGAQGDIFFVEDQTLSNNTIHIDSIVTDEPVWLIAMNAEGEDTTSLVADPVLIDPENNEEINLELNENAMLEGDEDGDNIVLRLHQDTGEEGTFEWMDDNELDPMLMDENDEPITYTVNLMAPSLVAEENQTVEDNQVAFSSVNTANDGYVAVYATDDEGNIDYTNPVGHTEVTAGPNEDVMVQFDEDFTYTAGETIYPRLHLDDPVDGEFTYEEDNTQDLPETYGFDEDGNPMYIDNAATDTGGFVVN